MNRLGWRTVAAGAGMGLVVLAMMVIVVSIAKVDGQSNWVFYFYLGGMAGLVAGARYAASRRPDAALIHGLLAALVAYAAFALVAVVARIVLDRGLDVVALTFNALLAGSAGILGTMIAERWPRPSQ